MREIGSVRNPALRRYRSLRDAAGRRGTGLAAAEGFNLLREALLSDVELVQVFLGERARRRPDFEALAMRLEANIFGIPASPELWIQKRPISLRPSASWVDAACSK